MKLVENTLASARPSSLKSREFRPPTRSLRQTSHIASCSMVSPSLRTRTRVILPWLAPVGGDRRPFVAPTGFYGWPNPESGARLRSPVRGKVYRVI